MKVKFWPKFVTEKSRSQFVTEILTDFQFFRPAAGAAENLKNFDRIFWKFWPKAGQNYFLGFFWPAGQNRSK